MGHDQNVWRTYPGIHAQIPVSPPSAQKTQLDDSFRISLHLFPAKRWSQNAGAPTLLRPALRSSPAPPRLRSRLV